ncbi:phosphoribosylanthranilate isomerase [Algoriphagus halophytocola]|uniref:N-(5'-phosphoribosyl)anthranilate isomerase n=1 Tax=Algoriphagus halophytocola TaxID=2991499 RepID=A0ABY6ML08_9BACT|nr:MULTISPECIES: phosphoribosylanthranilate isomerase [unclassified Algoriphagus]UZD23800.1 phosphoribosylanthranilate isomerase [Algoriphagus sp. TR-M5]WBL41167.1 phosphoribosylanthranilate isomerase [Algoriphagus sp. TR-M9]
MALKTFVKISGITNLSDARYCAGMYVDLLGFSLEKENEKFISPEEYSEITGWVSGLEFVGEFETYTSEQILEVVKAYPTVKWIEHDRLEALEDLEGKGFGLLYKMGLEEVRQIENEVAERLSSMGVIFHLTSLHEELTEIDFEAIRELTAHCKVILDAGITAENVNQLIEDLGLYGISLTGGDEIKPGLKDFDELADILEALEEEEEY